MTLAAGTKLGSYEILAPLGAGGMGEVWKARDARLGREVAIKVLPEDFFDDKERVARFEREAKLLAALNHPNIAAIYSFEEISGRHVLTMELIEGDDLAQRIAAGPLPLEEILSFARQIAEALEAAHEKGIVHRDLKPANVMVTKNGRVKVLDFGLAKVAALGDRTPVGSELPTDMRTQEGVVMGTVPYMSPEQVSGRLVDQRTDIFSLGVILYEMASGRRPFQGDSSAEVISSILRDVPRPSGELRAGLPGALDRLIGRCLEKDPDRRYATAHYLAVDLLLGAAAILLGLAAIFAFSWQGKYEVAREQVKRAADLDPTFFFPPWAYGWIDIQAGRPADAIREFQKARAMESPAFVCAWLAYAYGVSGDRVRALAEIEELKRRSLRGSPTAFDMAIVQLGLGDRARALENLEKAHAADSQWLGWLKGDRVFDPLRSDPRFVALTRKVGLDR